MSGLFDDDQAEDLPARPLDGPGLFGDASPVAASPAASPGAVAQTAAYRVLARKYRPTIFADLIGQEAMVRTLRNAFAAGRVAHAFMLTGVRGVGKTTTARIIARALNCTGPDGRGGPTADPCGVCPNCVAILADRHPDVMEMDAASRTGVDDVREIIEATRFRPLQARAKVFIIDEIHMLSRNAFNALLKTLEEPPPHVKFIFATTEIRKVPVTVLSRCQRFDLRRVSIGELSAHFARIAAAEGAPITPDAAGVIARAADGSVRDGLSLLDQAIALLEGSEITVEAVEAMLGLADRASVFDLFEALMAGLPAAALAITDRAHERGADLGIMLQDLLDLTYTVTRLRTVPGLRDAPDLPEAERTRGATLADRLSIPQLGRAWQMLLKGIGEVETAPDRRAAAEMVLIRLCHAADLPTPGDLVRQLSAAPREGAEAPPPPRPPAGGPGGIRAMAIGGSARAVATAAAPPDAPPLPAGPLLASFRDVVAFVEFAAGTNVARAFGAFGASGSVRAAGDRIASAADDAPRLGRAARRAASVGDRHALDDRAVRLAGGAHHRRAGRGGDHGKAGVGRRPPAGSGDHGGVPGREDRDCSRCDCRSVWLAARCGIIDRTGCAGFRTAGCRTRG